MTDIDCTECSSICTSAVLWVYEAERILGMKIIIAKLGIKYGYKFHYLPKQKVMNHLWFLSQNKQISV